MTRYFTHYWNKESVEDAEYLAEEGYDRLDHTASNRFRIRGVRPGAYVYVVNIRGGRMSVLGRMRVTEIINYDNAKRRLPYEPWEKNDHLIAEDGTATLLNFKRKVPMKTAERLRFICPDNCMLPPRPLKLSKANPKLLDLQTLRGVRELTEESAELLDQFVTE